MGIWTDIGAVWRGPVLAHSGTISAYRYVVIHTADGSFEGTISWQKNPAAGNSSHFVVGKDGAIAQVNDTANRSGAQIEGNPYSIAIENEGNENTPLTDAQLRANAKILAKAHAVHGIPLQLTGRVGTPGLGHHSMGAESGQNWGHNACPGEIIKGQKQKILNYAIQYAQGNEVIELSKTVDDVYNTLVGIVNGEQPSAGGHSAVPDWVKTMQSYGAKLDALATQLSSVAAKVDALAAKVNATSPGDVAVTGTLHLGTNA